MDLDCQEACLKIMLLRGTFFEIVLEETVVFVLHLRLYKVNVLGWAKRIEVTRAPDAGAFTPKKEKMMQQPMAPQPHAVGTVSPAPKKKNFNPFQLSVGILLFAVAILITLVLVFMVIGGGKSVDDAVKKDKYQAVFLDSQDGQVYFGKLESYNGMTYRLTDIYYVRVEQRIQPEGAEAAAQPEQNISLAKLGNELHGPEDEMFISRDKVLFWENLKEDGQVVKAIREFQKNPDAAAQNTTNQQQNGADAGAGAGTGAGTNRTTNP